MDVEHLHLKEVSALKLRIKFAKYGCMKFIGHLDVMRYFQKCMRRAEIPIAYSEGYSPHQIMSFALPLGVGVESYGEYMDIVTRQDVCSEQFLAALQSVMVEGMEILCVRKLPEQTKNAMASVQWADYRICFRDTVTVSMEQLRKTIEHMMEEPSIVVVKETKKSTREIDLRPNIKRMELDNDHRIFMCLKSGSEDNIKPELVMKAIYERIGKEFSAMDYMITREELYGTDFIPLIDFGEEF